MLVTNSHRQTVLITGGSGFIGRNLVEQLSNNYQILAPCHDDLELTDEDCVSRCFEDNAIDTVIHCAAKPGHRNAPDATALVYNNAKMFFNIARNAHRYKKLLFIGSGAVYDKRYYQPKMPEEYFDKHVPVDEHGFSEYIISKYIEKGENAVDLRIFGIFGKYEDYAIRFISNAICKSLFDLPITIKQNRQFDYIYINDLINVIDYFINHEPAHKAYNVTPDEAIDLIDIAEMVNVISGRNLPVIVDKPGTGLAYSGDNTRLRAEIVDLQLTPINDAIKNLYSWYQKNMDLINKEKLLIDL
jgi:UDP-glucose 4-epimerase